MTPPSDWDRAAEAIERLSAAEATPAQVAQAMAMDAESFRRFFTRWVGISPTRFHQAQVAARALTAGSSGPGRLHDVILHADAVTPGAHRRLGDGLTLRTGVHPGPFGDAFVAITDRGICHLSFVDGADALAAARARLAQDWPAAQIVEDQAATAPVAARATDPLAAPRGPLALHLKGTNFQLAVWRALLAVPPGALVRYADIARAIGRPSAVRAVGSAVGDNPVWVLVPCHRVLRSDGGLGGYAGGLARKQALRARELTAAR
jgi:AraC family transcriptional regulator of adaptative response/methylated-DNA-[protein]-cysteine methyltransferase